MKKTILTFVMLLMVALATQTTMAVPVNKTDSLINAKMQGVERVKEKIDKTLDDTIVSNDRDGWAVEMAKDSEMSAEDIKEISNQWANVFKDISLASIFGLLLLLFIILLFRYLTRRRKYDMMEKAIMNNYPLNDLTLNETKNTAIYVPQPVYPAPGVPVSNSSAPAAPMTMPAMNTMPNWRALMPAVKWMGWGIAIFLFGCCLGDFDNPFWPVGLALIFVGLCKGYILHKEQKTLQEAWERAKQMPPQEPMREGIPVPPPLHDYNSDVSAND